MSVGSEIKKARFERHWKQVDLITATGLNQRMVSLIEWDRTDPRLSHVLKIADALDLSLDVLCGRAPASKHGAA
jgi:transcriptional regulator with XRE-family HTH domain